MEILNYLVVDDVGRIVNPETLHGQVIGGAVQGLGSVFGEHLAYDADGQLLVASLADYLVPLATDYPNLHAVSLEEHPSPNNPLGVKGAGEGGVIAVAGAIANAVAAALSSLGVEPRELPLSPPAVWRLIERGRGNLASSTMNGNALAEVVVPHVWRGISRLAEDAPHEALEGEFSPFLAAPATVNPDRIFDVAPVPVRRPERRCGIWFSQNDGPRPR